MASGALALIGRALAVLVAALVLVPVAAVWWRSDGGGGLTPADWAAIRFTLTQAALSAAISVALAIPVAGALARRAFLGRGLLVTLLGAPFILPVIVAVLGILAVWGRSGVVSDLLAAAGLPRLTIYGLTGVVLTHVFFNLPLAVRLILGRWASVPAERFRLAASLGMGRGATWRTIAWPVLRSSVPGAALVIFLICTTSFAVALTLGGGPRATTVELAIYQAFRFEGDLARAAVLAGVQLVVTGVAAGLSFLVATAPDARSGGLDRVPQRWDGAGRLPRIADAAWIALAAAFLLAPLVAVAANGAAGVLALDAGVWRAAGRSLAVALASTALTLALAVPIGAAAVRRPWIEGAGLLSIAASPLVLGTGLFILARPFADPVALALPLTAVVNAMMSLPFALRAVIPAMAEAEAGWGRLADSLGMDGRARLRHLLLPRLRRPLGFAGGLAAALSMGDLGVVALFADPDRATLPLALYRLMAGYRMDEAAGAALLLVALSLALFWAFDRGGRADARA